MELFWTETGFKVHDQTCILHILVDLLKGLSFCCCCFIVTAQWEHARTRKPMFRFWNRKVLNQFGHFLGVSGSIKIRKVK